MGIAVAMKGGKADKNEDEKERETRSLDEVFSSKDLFLVYIIQKGHNDIDNLLMS